jgi:hypothetical protein
MQKSAYLLILLALCILCPTGNTFSQTIYEEYLSQSKASQTGINLSGITTGSGLGLSLNPSFFYRYKKNAVAIGPNIQRVQMNLSGLQGYFQHDFVSNFRQMIWYYHLNLLYHMQANLGPISNDQYRNIYGSGSDFKYRALEHYMGLGFKKCLSDYIFLDTGVGIGAYYILNSEEQPNKVPFKSELDLSLMIKVGLSYDFHKKSTNGPGIY